MAEDILQHEQMAHTAYRTLLTENMELTVDNGSVIQYRERVRVDQFRNMQAICSIRWAALDCLPISVFVLVAHAIHAQKTMSHNCKHSGFFNIVRHMLPWKASGANLAEVGPLDPDCFGFRQRRFACQETLF